ncbi:MAG: hypothetical protein LBQ63_04095 [Deltaproteobacteria bacterium]|jgi:TPR repeat protein|nr:hypothetical protein [Deltaproteobacteria bacterium]
MAAKHDKIIFSALLGLSALLWSVAAFCAENAPPSSSLSANPESILKSAVLPPPGQLPPKSRWPLPAAPEDPEWLNPELEAVSGDPSRMDKEGFPYRLCLGEALRGNPRAMLLLSLAYARWGEDLGEPPLSLPPSMRNAAYWLRRAGEFAGPAWVATRLGDLARDEEEKSAHYAQGAALGSPEAMYLYSLREKRPDMLALAAVAGHPEAAALAAFNLGAGTEGFPASPRLGASYWWLSALGGNSLAFLVCSEYFFHGLHGFPKDERKAALFALLALETAPEASLATARRHLEGIAAAAGFGEDAWWEIRREREIFLSASKEESRARLLRLRKSRDPALQTPDGKLEPLSLEPQGGAEASPEERLLSSPEREDAGRAGTEERRKPREEAGERERRDRLFLLLGLAGTLFLILGYSLGRLSRAGRLAGFLSEAVFLVLPLLLCLAAPGRSGAAQAADEGAQREAALIRAIRSSYTPPAPGAFPPDKEIPLSHAGDDPAWDTPLLRGIYNNPYSYGNDLDLYLPCLHEALRGNPRAMLVLSMFYYLWDYVLADMYPDFPARMHNSEYWLRWAEKFTDPGWVALGLGNLQQRWPASSLEHYRRAAELGNAEAMFHYYRLSGERKHYLYRSAALGFPRAAFLLGEELELVGGEESAELARRFTWLSALNGDAWGLLRSSIAFYNNEFGPEFDRCDQGYLYSLLSRRYNHIQGRAEAPPDSVCVFSQDKIAALEAEADNWQAVLEERRLPHILRGRYRREPLLEELRADLAPLAQILDRRLSVTQRADVEEAAPEALPPAGFISALPLPWHLGFYLEREAADNPFPRYAELHDELGLRARRLLSLDNDRQAALVRSFAGVVLPLSVGLLFYGQRRKKKRRQRRRAPL